jgi:hypothetical protein
MKKLLPLFLIVTSITLGVISCKNTLNQKKSEPEITPNWVNQNIDSESACKIILCSNIKIIKIGNSYTATYTFTDVNMTWFKVDKQTTGNDFAPSANWGIKYFQDSCKLKEELRWFIKLQMTKYVSDHLQNNIIN